MKYDGKYVKFWRRDCKEEIKRLENHLNLLGDDLDDYLISSRKLNNTSRNFLDAYYELLQKFSHEARTYHKNYQSLFIFSQDSYPNYAKIEARIKILSIIINKEIVRRHNS